ncbi:MAG: hypothetical protein LBM66_07085 [Bifidobacteriaceae bacterium]|jgi:hypothetical protein|nr:hypothetical protein [Bifidobacteriaceae bacterium]
MKRAAILKKLKDQAKRAGVGFETTELTNHTGVTIGGVRSTLKRHTEIDEVSAGRFFDQFASVEGFGKGWWRS